MAPSHQPLVFHPPGAALVRRIGDDPRGAQLADGEIDDRAGLTRREHELAADILARVVGLRRAAAHIDEAGRHIRRHTVLGQRQRHRVPVAQTPHAANIVAGPLDLPEFAGLHFPYRSRLLRPEHGVAVCGIAKDLDGSDAVAFELLLDVPRCHHELLACAHAVLQRYRIEVSFRRFTRGFRSDLAKRRFVDEFPQIGVGGRACQQRQR